ncbi:MAG: hypothetical protein AAF619_10145 [Pseudomonadota bacterium]
MTVQAISRWPDPQRGIALAARALILRTFQGSTEAFERGRAVYRVGGVPMIALSSDVKSVELHIMSATRLYDPFNVTRIGPGGTKTVSLNSGSDVRSPALIWVLTAARLECHTNSSSLTAMAR